MALLEHNLSAYPRAPQGVQTYAVHLSADGIVREVVFLKDMYRDQGGRGRR